MTQTQYTPAPWGYDFDNQQESIIVYGNNEQDLDEICTIPENERQEANARLIAAAPEILEALEALCKQEDWEGEDIKPDSPIGKAWAIIKKAKGEL